LYLKTHTCIK